MSDTSKWAYEYPLVEADLVERDTVSDLEPLKARDPAWRDPTNGRIDRDIQEYVDDMKPTSLGQRVAMEQTLQDKRDRER